MTGRVLLIEPDLHRRLRISAQLQAGYFTADIIADPNPDKVRRAARSADLILAPAGRDTRALVQDLRSRTDCLTTPIVIHTGDPIPSERRADWFLTGADAVLDASAPTEMLIERLSSLTRYKHGNDRLQEAYFGFCESPRSDETRAYDRARARDLPVLEFDPAHQGGAILGITTIQQEEELIGRLMATPDAMVRLVMRHPASAEVGLRLIPQIRSDAARRYLPVLAHFNPGQEMLAQTALQIGASDVVFGEVSEAEIRARLIAADRRRYWVAQVHTSILDQLRLSMVDPLTGLKNRRFADRFGPAHLARSQERGVPCSVIIVDIDRFKRINDEHGHPCGDRVLAVAARRIARAVRAHDLVCRIGGEEFLVVLPETGAEDAQNVAQRVRDAISRRAIRTGAEPESVSITVSAGIAVAPPTGETTFEMLVAWADSALYRSKTAGRDQVSLHDDTSAA